MNVNYVETSASYDSLHGNNSLLRKQKTKVETRNKLNLYYATETFLGLFSVGRCRVWEKFK